MFTHKIRMKMKTDMCINENLKKKREKKPNTKQKKIIKKKDSCILNSTLITYLIWYTVQMMS